MIFSRSFPLTFAVSIVASSALLSPTHAEEGDNAQRPDALIAGRDLGSQLLQYFQTTLYRHPTDQQIFAANCENQPQWWGRFCVFHQTGDWVAKTPPHYDEWEGHYIVTLKWEHLSNLDFDILEVVTSTHMGNGFLWLFTLEDQKLRPVLETPASGFADAPRFKKGLPEGPVRFSKPIQIDFQTPVAGGDEVVRITGQVIVSSNLTGETLARRTTTETWSWDPTRRIFDLNASDIHQKKRRTENRAPFRK